MRVYKLNENVLSIKGNAVSFLNGITSNVLEARENAFLNQHGRIIAVVHQQKIKDDEFLISVPALALEALLKHLERYIKLSHVEVTPSEQSIFINLDNNQSVWTSEHWANEISDTEFVLFRLEHDFPLMGVDYQADEFILNVHEHRFVSYTKGCFLGQEPVAKVHNRSNPSRRLIVQFEDQCSREDAVKMTSKVVDPASGRYKGFVFVGNNRL